jgi:hypothetical protein
MIDLKKEETLSLKIFLFVREENHGFIGKILLGYTLEDVIGFLSPHHWHPVGNLPVEDLLKDIGIKNPEEKVGKVLSLTGFKSSLLLSTDKFNDFLSDTDIKAIHRIVKKLPETV